MACEMDNWNVETAKVSHTWNANWSKEGYEHLLKAKQKIRCYPDAVQIMFRPQGMSQCKNTS
jgi:hypothetical protein